MLAYKCIYFTEDRYTSATAHEKSRRLFEGAGAIACTNSIVLKYECDRARKKPQAF